LGRRDRRNSKLATADYFRRIIAIFVVRMGFPVAEIQSTPCLSRHTVSRYAVRDVTRVVSMAFDNEGCSAPACDHFRPAIHAAISVSCEEWQTLLVCPAQPLVFLHNTT
jgi:hypothetical protein